MKAVRIYEHGEIDTLIYDDVPEPPCPSDKVKVQIKASGLNHLDIWVRKGFFKKAIPIPIILGSDASGTIVEVGNRINNYHLGDNVVIQPGIFCGECQDCANGNEN